MKKMMMGMLGLGLGLGLSPAAATQYGWQAQLDAISCTAGDIGDAAQGDFKDWVLPGFVPGKHLAAGQWTEPMRGADGVLRCPVNGK